MLVPFNKLFHLKEVEKSFHFLQSVLGMFSVFKVRIAISFNFIIPVNAGQIALLMTSMTDNHHSGLNYSHKPRIIPMSILVDHNIFCHAL